MASIMKVVFFHLSPELLQIMLNFCGTSGHVVSLDLVKRWHQDIHKGCHGDHFENGLSTSTPLQPVV